MFEKNVRIYRITENLNLEPKAFDSALGQFKCGQLTAQEALRMGFTQPVKGLKSLVHVGQDGLLLIAVKRVEKLLPGAVVDEELQPKVEAMEQEKARPLSRKEKQCLKEELIQTLLPRAFSKSVVTHAVIDTRQNLVFVFTTSAARAEEVLALLRKSIGSLPLLPWIDGHDLSGAMQQWIKGQGLPENVQLGHAVEFKAPDEEGATARFSNQLLTVDEVQHCVKDKLVRKVELFIADRVSFTVADDGSVKGMDWSDIVMNKNDELGWDDVVARTDADLLIFAQELRNIVGTVSAVISEFRQAA